VERSHLASPPCAHTTRGIRKVLASCLFYLPASFCALSMAVFLTLVLSIAVVWCGMRKIGRRLDVRATPKIWFGTCESARNVVLRAVQGMFLHACFVCVCMVEAIFGCADRPGCIFSACPRLCLSGVAAARSVGAGNPFDARLRVRASFGQRSVLGGRCSRARRSLRFQGIDATLVLCTPSRFLRVWCTPCR